MCRLTLLFSDIEFDQTNHSATRADCDPSPEPELLAGDYIAFQSWKRSAPPLPPESREPLPSTLGGAFLPVPTIFSFAATILPKPLGF